MDVVRVSVAGEGVSNPIEEMQQNHAVLIDVRIQDNESGGGDLGDGHLQAGFYHAGFDAEHPGRALKLRGQVVPSCGIFGAVVLLKRRILENFLHGDEQRRVGKGDEACAADLEQSPDIGEPGPFGVNRIFEIAELIEEIEQRGLGQHGLGLLHGVVHRAGEAAEIAAGLEEANVVGRLQ